MADNTAIEWTDATWNPVTGCSVISPGCTNCYAMKLAGTRLKHHPSRAGLTQDGKAGAVWNGRVRFNEEWLDQPLRWKRGRRIFVCAHGDLFHENVPDEWIDRVFAVMALCPQHTFQVLTKRPERMRDYLTAEGGRAAPSRQVAFLHSVLDEIRRSPPFRYDELARTVGNHGFPIYGEAGDWPLPNVWLGVSVEDQPRADERLFALSCTPAAKRFASIEPLLGKVDVTRCRENNGLAWNALTCDLWSTVTKEILAGPPKGHGPLDWVIGGGESGLRARPWSIQWARQLRDQCVEAGVAFFWKQNGEWRPARSQRSGTPGRFAFGDYEHDPGLMIETGYYPREFNAFGARSRMERVGKKAAGRLLDGRDWSEFPA